MGKFKESKNHFFAWALPLAILGGASGEFAQAKEAAICRENGEVVLVKLPPPRTDALLVKCEQSTNRTAIEPRPFSRAELAKLYNESRGSTPREVQQKKWAETFGINAESLMPNTSDEAMGRETLQFPQSEDLAALRELAQEIQLETSAGKIREVQISTDISMQAFDSSRLRLFANLCEQSGGQFSIPEKFLEEFQLGTRQSLGGETVCKCRGTVFSNPVDHDCNKTGDRKFREKDLSERPGRNSKPAKQKTGR